MLPYDSRSGKDWSTSLSTLLGHLEAVQHTAQGYEARCPAHDDQHPSLTITVGQDDRILVHCFAGCSAEAIVAALGLTLADLFPRSSPSSSDAPRRPLTVAELAAAKALPIEFLRRLRLTDSPKGVGIPYRDATGQIIATKQRTNVVAKNGSYWPKGQRLVAYGLDRLDEAHTIGQVVLVEGESDCWTLWHHDIPALGIPGAASTNVLTDGLLAGIGTVFVIQESDDAGAQFVRGVRRRLAESGWQGDLAVLTMSPAFKDPNGLHQHDSARFSKAWTDLVQAAAREAFPSLADDSAMASGESPSATPEWPSALDPAALCGLAGQVVNTIAPHSEADPVGLLVQFLVCFGNAIGRDPHTQVESTRHALNEFALLVGPTAKGRKGTGLNRIRALFAVGSDSPRDPWDTEDPEGDAWERHHWTSGLSSGEGLITALRYAGRQPRPDNSESSPDPEFEGVDHRLLVVEDEFSRPLTVMRREGNTLEGVLRQGWDGTDLSVLTVKPVSATEPHLSVIGHVTKEELLRQLTATSMANGFLNRFLLVAVQRAQLLPHGSPIPEALWRDVRTQVRAAVGRAQGLGLMARSPAANERWADVYPELSKGQPGWVGAILGRAEAHVLRLSTLYAALDGQDTVEVVHLEAALALWAYVEASVRWVFGRKLGHALADQLDERLRAMGPDGLSRTAIGKEFDGHQSKRDLDAALMLLQEAGLARPTRRATGGRPEERWVTTDVGRS